MLGAQRWETCAGEKGDTAHLGDGVALQHGHGVSLADGGEPVRDHQGAASDHEAVQRLLHELLLLGIECAGGLVQQQYDGDAGAGGPGGTGATAACSCLRMSAWHRCRSRPWP